MAKKKMNKAQSLKIPNIPFPSDIFTYYLSHPFVSREYIREWELGVEERHPNIALLNPFYDVEGEGRSDVKARDEKRKVEKDAGYNWRLCARDKIAIEFSRGIVGIVDKNSAKSIGTIMEFVYARCSASNPKLLVCSNKNLQKHPWLSTHFHEIYHSLDELEEDLEYQTRRVQKKWGF
jgi:hypothetical protein